jgi:hypothetical protein
MSDYAWGSIPYHYGTWVLDPYLGWIWVPGYVWAPSWVVFSSGPDYIGWAPVPPRFVVGAPIGFATFAPERCVVVPAHAFLAPRVRGFVVPRSTAHVALSHTRIVNNITVENHIVVNHGPDPRGIERAAGRSVRPVPISRVRNVTPTGRFDAAEVRADRHDRSGAAPRVTAPEPVAHEPARAGAVAHAPGVARQSEPVRGNEARRPAHVAPPVSSRPPETSRPPPSPHPSETSRPPQKSHPPEAYGSPGNSRPPDPAQGGQSQKASRPSNPHAPTHANPQQKPPKPPHGGRERG